MQPWVAAPRTAGHHVGHSVDLAGPALGLPRLLGLLPAQPWSPHFKVSGGWSMTTIPKAGIVCEKSFLIIGFSCVCVCVRECEIVCEYM